MPDSVLNYNDIVDIRFDPHANNGAGEYQPYGIGLASLGWGNMAAEVRTIDANGKIKLFEAPMLRSPSSTVITIGATTLREVSRAKSKQPDEFSVIYYDTSIDALGMGEIQFSLTRIGQQATIKYYGLGHLYQKISLDSRVPSTGNTTIAGNKTFTGNTVMNGSLNVDGIFSANNGTSYKFNISATGQVSTNDAAPDVSANGLCLNQGGADTNILTFKSSDVAHGITDFAETDTYAAFMKYGATSGGFYLSGFSSGRVGCYIRGFVDDENLGDGAITIDAKRKSGTGTTSLTSGALLSIENDGSQKVRIEYNGKIYAGAGGIRTWFENGALSNPPTAAELDALFGNYAATGSGFFAIAADNSDFNCYIVFRDEVSAEWRYCESLRAV